MRRKLQCLSKAVLLSSSSPKKSANSAGKSTNQSTNQPCDKQHETCNKKGNKKSDQITLDGLIEKAVITVMTEGKSTSENEEKSTSKKEEEKSNSKKEEEKSNSVIEKKSTSENDEKSTITWKINPCVKKSTSQLAVQTDEEDDGKLIIDC